MFAGFFRELEYLINHKWDLSLVTLAPVGNYTIIQ